jgi:hypothetical protein
MRSSINTCSSADALVDQYLQLCRRGPALRLRFPELGELLDLASTNADLAVLRTLLP